MGVSVDSFRTLIKSYPGIWRDMKKFKALLMDVYPGDKLRRNLIILSAEEGIPDELIEADISRQQNEMNYNRYKKRLSDSCGCSNEMATEIVLLWVNALSNDKDHSMLSYNKDLPDDYGKLSIDSLGLSECSRDFLYSMGVKDVSGLSKLDEGLWRGIDKEIVNEVSTALVDKSTEISKKSSVRNDTVLLKCLKMAYNMGNQMYSGAIGCMYYWNAEGKMNDQDEALIWLKRFYDYYSLDKPVLDTLYVLKSLLTLGICYGSVIEDLECLSSEDKERLENALLVLREATEIALDCDIQDKDGDPDKSFVAYLLLSAGKIFFHSSIADLNYAYKAFFSARDFGNQEAAGCVMIMEQKCADQIKESMDDLFWDRLDIEDEIDELYDSDSNNEFLDRTGSIIDFLFLPGWVDETRDRLLITSSTYDKDIKAKGSSTGIFINIDNKNDPIIFEPAQGFLSLLFKAYGNKCIVVNKAIFGLYPIIKEFVFDGVFKLTDRKRYVLNSRFGLKDGNRQTSKELAEKNVTKKERITYFESDAIKYLQEVFFQDDASSFKESFLSFVLSAYEDGAHNMYSSMNTSELNYYKAIERMDIETLDFSIQRMNLSSNTKEFFEKYGITHIDGIRELKIESLFEINKDIEALRKAYEEVKKIMIEIDTYFYRVLENNEEEIRRAYLSSDRMIYIKLTKDFKEYITKKNIDTFEKIEKNKDDFPDRYEKTVDAILDMENLIFRRDSLDE